jgi:hypothetical protein
LSRWINEARPEAYVAVNEVRKLIEVDAAFEGLVAALSSINIQPTI